MRSTGIAILALGVMMAAHAGAVSGNSTNPEALRACSDWVLANFQGKTPREADASPPFSFRIGGTAFSDVLSSWSVNRSSAKLDQVRTEHRSTWADPATSLTATMVSMVYDGLPVVEWTVYLKNEGQTTSPLIEELQAFDGRFERGASGEFVLHHQLGSICTREDYKPLDTPLPPDARHRITTSGGRSSNSDFPYFDIEWPEGRLLLAIGWPGQWAADFARDSARLLAIRVGQQTTRFRLLPGEEVRTPLIALYFWRGDRIDAHNAWRRWMLEYNLPRPHGRPVHPQLAACSSHQFAEMINANEENQKLFVDRYLAEGLKLDYWWMDAGWYVNNGTWPNTGTWEVDRKRFPGGLRAITDHARAKGVKSIVWFEPERVTPGTWLYDNHPDWCLGRDGEQKLLNLGNPEAWKWLVGHVDGLIGSEGIDLYRNDFNIDPLDYWRSGDAPEREGITENKYVSGFLAWWDELRRRHPDMLIDTCASGGRRNDLETLRRSVPLLRSDYLLEPIGQQCHTQALSMWVPFYGTGTNAFDAYAVRGTFCPHLTGCWDVRKTDSDYESVRKLCAEWKAAAPLMLGDYYPLTAYSTAEDVWMAWQFDRPEEGRGMIQAFRRAASPYESARFQLRGLDPGATYRLSDADTSETRTMGGEVLMREGLLISLNQAPSSALLFYQR